MDPLNDEKIRGKFYLHLCLKLQLHLKKTSDLIVLGQSMLIIWETRAELGPVWPLGGRLGVWTDQE